MAFIPSPKHPDLPALLVELKYNRDADTALGQVLRQQHPARLVHYRGNTLLVGINYDKDVRSDTGGFKHHTCRIERA